MPLPGVKWALPKWVDGADLSTHLRTPCSHWVLRMWTYLASVSELTKQTSKRAPNGPLTEGQKRTLQNEMTAQSPFLSGMSTPCSLPALDYNCILKTAGSTLGEPSSAQAEGLENSKCPNAKPWVQGKKELCFQFLLKHSQTHILQSLPRAKSK